MATSRRGTFMSETVEIPWDIQLQCREASLYKRIRDQRGTMAGAAYAKGEADGAVRQMMRMHIGLLALPVTLTGSEGTKKEGSRGEGMPEYSLGHACMCDISPIWHLIGILRGIASNPSWHLVAIGIRLASGWHLVGIWLAFAWHWFGIASGKIALACFLIQIHSQYANGDA